MNIGDTAVPGSLLIIPRISTCKVVTRGLSFQEQLFLLYSYRIKEKLKLGYKIKILSGVLYDRNTIFTNYIQTLYNMRLEHPKGTPINLLCKLLNIYPHLVPRLSLRTLNSGSDPTEYS